MSIGMRIKEIRKAKKMNQAALSDVLGVTQAAISRYESDQQYPGGEFLQKMSSMLAINTNWLLTGTGPMFQELQQIDASFLNDTITLPIVGEIAAGEPCEMFYEEPLKLINLPRALLRFPPPYHVFRVSGKSMEPHILTGDIVICSQDWRNVDVNGKIMAFRTSEGITIKRLMDDHKNRITWLMPINQEFTPMPYTEDNEDITMIGILDLSIRHHNL